jgi:hypothetical protein
MTIENAKELKTKVENQILYLLNDLEKETKCQVTSIYFNKTMEEGMVFDEQIDIGREVKITIKLA